MSNIFTLARPQEPTPSARYEEIAPYGTAGALTVALARRADVEERLIHVVLMGSAIGLEIVAPLPDNDKGRAVADFVGLAVVRSAELAEIEFDTRPGAC